MTLPLDVRLDCPAKINLFLEVTRRRRDGYHDLATVFAKLSLKDSLLIRRSAKPGIRLRIQGPLSQGLSSGRDNLVVRAAQAYFKGRRVESGVDISLIKRIPMGAGLGGGSSDAAGTLLGLSRLFARHERDNLKKLAIGLGADVPFFLEEAPVCLARGIGDRLRPLKIGKAFPWLILVYPGVGVPTAEAYGRLRVPPSRDVLTRLRQLDKLTRILGGKASLQRWEGLVFNRLESAVLPHYPEVGRAAAALERFGARAVLMSGSGSCVFGFAMSRSAATRVRDSIKRLESWRVEVCRCGV